MITLLTGKKGSGKTKKLIEKANSALETSKGCVVVIEKGINLTYNLPHSARLVDAEAYGIKNCDELFGFLSGICAGNYDVTDIFVDSTFKIINAGPEVIDKLIKELKKLSDAAETNIVLLISATNEELPDSVSEYILQ